MARATAGGRSHAKSHHLFNFQDIPRGSFILYFPLNLTEGEDMSYNYSDTHTNTVRRDYVNRFGENYTRS